MEGSVWEFRERWQRIYSSWAELYKVIYSIFFTSRTNFHGICRDQLFFISFARIWARAIKPAAAVSFLENLHASGIWRFYQVQRIRTDPHSPTRFRVDGTVSNIPEFAEAFKCSKKAKVSSWFVSDDLDISLPSAMQLNPPNEDRCIFWS